jgi:hypothetical protein
MHFSLLTSLSNQINGLGKKINGLENKFNQFVGIPQKKLLRDAVVHIQSRVSNTSVTTGNGIYVTIPPNFYIATAAHVICPYTQTNQSATQSPSLYEYQHIRFGNHDLLEIDDSAYIFKSNDLALIQVLPHSNHTAVRISTEDVDEGEFLYGFAVFDNLIYIRCKVVEFSSDTKDVLTDCSGSPGTSGMGFLNLNSDLTAIFIGRPNYPHSTGRTFNTSFKQSKQFSERWNAMIDNCFNNYNQLCSSQLSDSMTILANNPRSKIELTNNLLNFANPNFAFKIDQKKFFP